MELNAGPTATFETSTPSVQTQPVAATPPTPVVAPQSAPSASSPAPTQQHRVAGETAAETKQRLVLESLAQRGLDVSAFDSDDSFLDEFQNEYQSLQQTKALAKYGRQFMSQREQFEQWLESQNQQSPKPDQTNPKKSENDPWGPLEYDDRWEQHVTWDGKRYVPRDEYANPTIADKMNEYHRSQADRLRKLARDPIGSLKPYIEQEARRIADELYQQNSKSTQSQQLAQEFIARNYDEWVVKDAHGNPRIDPSTGMELMTPKGLRAFELAHEADRLGIQGAENRRQYVAKLLAAEFPSHPATPASPAAPVETPEQKQDAFIARAESRGNGQHRPNTSTAVATAPTRLNPASPDSFDFKALLKEQAAKAGIPYKV